MMRRIAALGTVVLLCSLSVFASGSQDAKPAAGTAPAAAVQPGSVPLKTPILWYLRAGLADVADLPLVNQKLNELLAAKGFNAGVRIEFINRPDYDTKMNLINTAGEAYDLALSTEGWFNIYTRNINSDFILNLSDYKDPSTGKTVHLLKEYAPKLWASMGEGTWESTRYRDGIYAIINQQIYVLPLGVSIREDVMNALNLKSAIDGAKSYADLTPIMDRIYKSIKAGELKGKVELSENLTGVFTTCDLVNAKNAGYDMLAGGIFGVKYDDPSAKIVNWYESPEYTQFVKLRRSWTDAGYTPKDKLDNQAQINGYKAGQYVMDIGRGIKPGGNVEQKTRMGLQTAWYEKAISPTFLNTGGPTATLTVVNSLTGKDPERAKAVIRFMELVHTDSEVYNLIAKGIEGVHYEWADRANKVIKPISGSKYNPNVDWAIGNQFHAYYLDPAQVGAWEATKKLNDSAKVSVATGFRFVSEPVKNEIAAVATVLKEFGDPLGDGMNPNVDEGLAKLRDGLKKAGSAAIEAELVKQFNAWKAGKK